MTHRERAAPEQATVPAGDSRGRILGAALELFTSRGYRATSMREVAEQVGLTKATLYHHFRSKSEIVQGLLTPLLDRLDEELAQAPTRERFLQGCVDTMLTHRRVLSLLLRDTSVYYDEAEIGARMMGWVERATTLLAGPEADWPERIRAAQAIAAIADPITLAVPAPDEVLRRELLRGARLLLDRDAG